MKNNDRFRFRVWNKKRKQWYSYLCLDCLSGHIPGLNEDNDIVEQCTGLKDKNGKLIYEGDIIDFSIFGQEYTTRKGLIKYAKEDACFGVFFSNNLCLCFNRVAEETIEVIGNLHENPELLKECK